MGVLPHRNAEETTLLVAGVLPGELRGRNYTDDMKSTWIDTVTITMNL